MRKLQFVIQSLALSALALPLYNCGESAHDPVEAYYLVTANSKIPYWQSAVAGLSQACTEMKVQGEMVGPDKYDVQAEKAEFQRIVQTKKPAGILVSAADSTALKPEIDAAVAAGIPVVTMDSDAPTSKRLMFIGTDNYEAGRMGAAVLAKQLNGKGNVVVFTMPEQANLRARLQGYEAVLKGYPGIKIQETVDIKGEPAAAFDHTKELIDKKAPVDAFVCLEALACPEVAEVLNRANVKGKVVVAMDTDPRTIDWVQKGLIAATIAQKPYTMAYFGVHVLDQIHHHKPQPLDANWSQDTRSPMPAIIDTGATLIDKNSVDSFLKANPPTAK